MAAAVADDDDSGVSDPVRRSRTGDRVNFLLTRSASFRARSSSYIRFNRSRSARRCSLCSTAVGCDGGDRVRPAAADDDDDDDDEEEVRGGGGELRRTRSCSRSLSLSLSRTDDRDGGGGGGDGEGFRRLCVDCFESLPLSGSGAGDRDRFRETAVDRAVELEFGVKSTADTAAAEVDAEGRAGSPPL